MLDLSFVSAIWLGNWELNIDTQCGQEAFSKK